MKKVSKFWLNWLIVFSLILTYISFPDSSYAEKDISKELKDMKISAKQNKKPLGKNDTINFNDSFTFEIDFKIPSKFDNPKPEKFVEQNDTATIVLGEGINILSSEKKEINVKASDGKTAKLGTYEFIQNGKNVELKILFDADDGLLGDQNYNNFEASASAQFKIDSEYISDGKEEIKILDETYKVVVPTLAKISKRGKINPKTQTVEWTVDITVTNGGKPVDLNGYKVIDDLKKAGKYVDNSFKKNGAEAALNEVNENQFIYEFKEESMSPQTLKFETALTSEEFFTKKGEIQKYNSIILFNKESKEVAKDSNYVRWNPKFISKTARQNSENGQNYFKEGEDYYIYWEIVVNGFEEENVKDKIYANLKEVKIQDVLQKLNGPYRELEYISSTLEEWDEKTEKWNEVSNSIKPDSNSIYDIGDIEGKRVKLTIKSKINSPNLMSSNKFENTANIWWDGVEPENSLKSKYSFEFGGRSINKYTALGTGVIENLTDEWGLYWTGSEAVWTINVTEDIINPDSKVYDMMIHNTSMSYTDFRSLFQQTGQEYNLTIELEDGTKVDSIDGIKINNLRPGDLEYLKLDFDKTKDLNSETNLNFETYKIFDSKDRYVADLLVVSGFKNSGKYDFKVKGDLVEPRTLINDNKDIDKMNVVNTAYLMDKYNNTSISSWTAHTSKMLDKSVLKAQDAQDFENSYDSAILNNNPGDNKDTAFNHKTKSVIYKLSINADQNKNTKDTLGKLTLTDTLSDGWEFVNIKDEKSFLIYEGNPEKGTDKLEDLMSFDARVNAIGKEVDLQGLDVKTENSNKMIFTFDNIDKAYVIVLKAKIKDEKLKEYMFESGEAINTATLESEKVSHSGKIKGEVTKQQAVKVNTTAVDKTNDGGTNNGVLKWTVNYKPYDVITQTGVEIYLQDTMSDGMELRRNADGSLDFSNDNIVIEEIELSADGTITSISKLEQSEVESLVSYDAKERQLKLKIQDHKKAYRFTYITDIISSADLNISNKVELIGSNLKDLKPAESAYTVSEDDFTATMQRNPWMEIKKVDSTNNNMALEDAHFGLFEIGNDKPIRNGVTNKNGRLIFNAIPDGEYILKEIQAPSGYQLDETAYTVKVNRGVSSGEPVVSINGKTDKTSHQITIENSKTTSPQPQVDGQIKVSKKVTDTTQELDKEFEFSLVLTDLPENSPEEYAYEKTGEEKGNLVKAEDKYQFKLSNGQEIVIKGLPRTARYEIKEKDYSSENYITTAINNIGTIVDNEEIKVEFINKKELLPQVTTNAILQINKKIVGTGISGEDKFKFKIFFDTDPTKEYSYKINGVSQADKLTNEKEFELQGEQSIVIEDIADKERFTIKETDYLDYTPEKMEDSITVAITSGNSLNIVNFINQKDKVEPENGKLRVKKIVRGNGGDREREFEFTVKIGTDANASYKYIGENIESGLIKGEDVIKLKHGQSIIIQDIPIGTEYTVTEADYTSDGYETKVIGNSGLISITESTAEFTNTRQISSNTGGGGDGGNTPEPKPEPKPSPKPEPEPNPETPKPTTEITEEESDIFVEDEETPEGKVIENKEDDNKTEILENKIPKALPKRLPKTGNEQGKYYLIGLILLTIGVVSKKRKK